ncbi:MAG: hypothetical protein QFX36_05980 [Archaeoglobales archaeon]|nr:hypothetical protein [Archaeoglobales archaeon]
MRKVVVSAFIGLFSPLFFIFFLILYDLLALTNEFLLAILTAFLLPLGVVLYISRRSKKVQLYSVLTFALFGSFSLIFALYLPGILLAFDFGPAEHWPKNFAAQRLNFSSIKEIRIEEWTFEKPENYRSVYSIKADGVGIAFFYYPSIELANKEFEKFRKFFEKSKASFIPEDRYSELRVKDYFEAQNNKIVYSELLFLERSGKASILVAIAEQNSLAKLSEILSLNFL